MQKKGVHKTGESAKASQFVPCRQMIRDAEKPGRSFSDDGSKASVPKKRNRHNALLLLLLGMKPISTTPILHTQNTQTPKKDVAQLLIFG